VAYDIAGEFEKHRRLLFGLGLRLLGNRWDAEDLVQDAYLRWVRADRTDVREPRAFLITVVARLARDQVRSPRVARRADYAWDSVPGIVDHAPGPSDVTQLHDEISTAIEDLMERLSPQELAVFILREAFGLPYAEIAPVVGASPAGCRQSHVRGRRRMAEPGRRYPRSRQGRAEIPAGFLSAARSGELAPLLQLLADDVHAWRALTSRPASSGMREARRAAAA
jgi:RNA polymerase sigma-70 factor (ECF subfamily)